MKAGKNILAIIGSADKNSSGLKLVQKIAALTSNVFAIKIFDALKALPHFDPELSINDTPEIIIDFRNTIQHADGIIICTPEYTFSIPSGLKNVIEWCVSTTVFSNKPIGLITASASGAKAHEELKLIMRTVETIFNDATTLLINGIKAKIDVNGNIIDDKTNKALIVFTEAFKKLVDETDEAPAH